MSTTDGQAHGSWQPSPAFTDHARRPRNVGLLLGADGHARFMGECGDEMTVWIKTAGDRIRHATFTTSGCATSHASGSMAVTLATGRDLHTALRLTQQEVLDALGGLPADHEHCALLAATTVQLACEEVLLRRLEGKRAGIR